MDDVIGAEILDPTQDLSKEVHSLMLAQLPFFLEIMIEIIIAQLGNDVHVIIGLEDIMQPHNILMANLLHYLDLGMEVFEIEVAGEDALVYYLYRHWLTGLCDLAAVD